MIGKKIALGLLGAWGRLCGEKCLPETEEKDTEEDSQNANADGLSLLKDLDNAVHEGSDPKKPLQQRHQHERGNDGNVNNLVPLVLVLAVSDSELINSHVWSPMV
jgi:hypothetical protein